MADLEQRKSARGRPSAFKPAKGAQIVALVRMGAGQVEAAASVGINRSTMLLWLREGARARDRMERDGHPLEVPDDRWAPADLAEFSDMMERAISVAVVFHQTQAAREKSAHASNLWLMRRQRLGVVDELKKQARKAERGAARVGTDLEEEIAGLRRRLGLVRALIERGGTDGTPLDRLMMIETAILRTLGRLVALQSELHPGSEKKGDLRVLLELTSGLEGFDLGPRAPELEADASPVQAPKEQRPRGEPPAAQKVGATGNDAWDEVDE